MDIEHEDGTKEHIKDRLPEVSPQWSDPDEIEAPRIKHIDTGRIFTVTEINFAARYVTFIVDEEFSFNTDEGMRVYPSGSLCMKTFDDILIE